jgi:hypothetical protein
MPLWVPCTYLLNVMPMPKTRSIMTRTRTIAANMEPSTMAIRFIMNSDYLSLEKPNCEGKFFLMPTLTNLLVDSSDGTGRCRRSHPIR